MSEGNDDKGETGAGGLTHFDRAGHAQMVDISEKAETARIAVASCQVLMAAETLALVTTGTAKKGDVAGVARLAGIMAAKRTSELIPLCHPLPLSAVTLEIEPQAEPAAISIRATCRTTGQTGVEMEALTAAGVAALTVYDMLKAVDRGMTITDLCVEHKSGGKSGRYDRGGR